MGLHRAGFDVTGVDIVRQTRYPFRFVRGDALRPPFDLSGFDFIWASPHCQPYTLARNMKTTAPKPEQIPEVRALLTGAHGLTCIENVPRSPLRKDLVLNGWMFPELRVIRERWFELNFFVMGPPLDKPRDLLRKGYISVIGSGTPPSMVARGIRYLVGDCRRAMGIPWMSRKELSQAVPPLYSEFIGRAALNHLARSEAA